MVERKYIRDPIYGFIEIEEDFLRILDTHLFQRLRYIKQNGLGYLTFPGMVHTRFEHSLGVFELTRRLLDWIKKNVDKEGILDKSGIDLIEEQRRGILGAALLHDIGHTPFSHVLEGVLTNDESHEKLGISLIENSLIKEDVDEGLVRDALKILKRVYAEEKLRNVSKEELMVQTFSSQLLGSQMDVDRMDFLIRDSYHSGVRYGVFDVERMLRVVVVIGGNLAVMAPPEKSVPIVEEFILSRYEMYRQVYYHKVSESYNGMLKLLIMKLKDNGLLTFVKRKDGEPKIAYSVTYGDGGSYSGEIEYRYFDDTWVLQLIKSIMRRGIGLDDHIDKEIIESLARRIICREHYRTAFTIEEREEGYVKFRETLYAQLVQRKQELDNILYDRGLFISDKKIRPYYLPEKDGEMGEIYIVNVDKAASEAISYYSRLLKHLSNLIVPIFRIYSPDGKLPDEVLKIIDEVKREADIKVKAE